MKANVHWMLIGTDDKVAYDRHQEVEVSEDGRVITTTFPEPMVFQEGDRLIGEINLEIER